MRVSVFAAPGSWGLGETPARPRPPLQVGWARRSAGRARCSWLAAAPGSQAGLGLRGGADREAESSSAAAAAAAAAGLCLYRSPAQAAEPGPLRAETVAAAPARPARRSPRRRPASAERQARGADLPREDAPTRTWDPASPCVLLPQPHPGLRLRFTALPCLWPGAPPLGPQRASRASLDPSPFPHPRVVRPPCSAPRAPHFPRSGHSLPTPRRPSPLDCTSGVRVPAGREWPSICTGTRAEEPAVRGGGCALRSLGAGRAPWFPPRCGARPGNLSPGARPIQGQKSAQSWPVFPPRASRTGTGPGGRGEAGGVSPVALRERNRQVGVYSKTPGWSRGVRQPCPRRPGWRRSYRAPGQPSPRAGPHFLSTGFELPRANVQRSVKLSKNLNASVSEAGVGGAAPGGREMSCETWSREIRGSVFTASNQVKGPPEKVL